MESLNDRIKKLRKNAGMTQAELADKLGVTDKAVSKWESGEGDPSLSLLTSLASVFDVTMDYLVTGKEAKEKIVVMSKIELCCKKDDPKLFNELENYKDENGKSIIFYINKYNAKNVFKSYVEHNHKISLSTREKLNEDSSMMIKLAFRFKDYSSLKKMGLNPSEATGDCSHNIMFPSMYHTAVVSEIVDSWPDKKYIDGFFKLHETNPQLNYMDPYKRFKKLALKSNNVELIKYVLAIVFEFNKANKEAYKNWGGYKQLSYSFSNGSEAHYFYTIPFSSKEIISLCELGLVDEGREANNYIYDGNNTKKIEENQFKKYEIIKKGNKGKMDTRIFDVTNEDILVLHRLTATEDASFIVDCLKKYPLCYAELFADLFLAKDYKGFFNKAVDLGIDSLAQGIMKQKDPGFEIGIYEMLSTIADHKTNTSNGTHSLYQKLYNIDNSNRDMTFALDVHFRQLFRDLYDEDAEELKKKKQMAIDGITKISKHYKDIKESYLTRYEATLKARELIKDNYTEEFFIEKLNKGDIETVVIKLCTLFEMKLKAQGKTGDFLELVNSYCQQFYGDDGWGYIVCNDEHKVDILNRLRMLRNNYLHADAKDVKPLSKDELKECINEICKLEVR